jgi:ABC-type sugar transport system ATPase subunit
MKVQIENLSKKWGDVIGVDAINLDIKDGEFVAFLGPSGCGKTTTLLMIAGIYKPTEGFIRFDGHVVNQVAPKDRHIGMVFQSYALYPHMTVYKNIGYPLKIQKIPKDEMKKRVQTVADMMGIGHLMERTPGLLSGGQQQRVALGRALVKEPQLLLFDEPLSNLDARLRLSMRSEIKRLQMELGITSIYVTHDQVEAMTMADYIAVMMEGKLQAYAPPDELYDRPLTQFVASFVGNPPMNLFEVEVIRENGDYHARREGLDVLVSAERGEKVVGKGPVVMGIRPEDMTVANEGNPGEIQVVEPLGRDHLVAIQVGDIQLNALTEPKLGLEMGDNVNFNIHEDKVQFFDLKSQESLLW